MKTPIIIVRNSVWKTIRQDKAFHACMSIAAAVLLIAVSIDGSRHSLQLAAQNLNHSPYDWSVISPEGVYSPLNKADGAATETYPRGGPGWVAWGKGLTCQAGGYPLLSFGFNSASESERKVRVAVQDREKRLRLAQDELNSLTVAAAPEEQLAAAKAKLLTIEKETAPASHLANK